jgi:hypothetical protein
MLARNLQRQIDESGLEHRRQEAVDLALHGALRCPTDSGCILEGCKVLRDLRADNLNLVVEDIVARYPRLEQEIREAAKIRMSQELWVEGKRWIAKPNKDLSDVANGVELFGEIARLDPQDYWSRILYGGCLFWSQKPAVALSGPLEEALKLDPGYPHSYSLAAQCLLAVGRKDEAVEKVNAMLDYPDLKLHEPDHFDKVIEAMQVAANVLLPDQGPRFELMRNTACLLFPTLNVRLMAIKKKEAGCVIA